MLLQLRYSCRKLICKPYKCDASKAPRLFGNHMRNVSTPPERRCCCCWSTPAVLPVKQRPTPLLGMRAKLASSATIPAKQPARWRTTQSWWILRSIESLSSRRVASCRAEPFVDCSAVASAHSRAPISRTHILYIFVGRVHSHSRCVRVCLCVLYK